MKISIIHGGARSVLTIRSCILHLLKHARVANAALAAVPNATVTTSGVLCLRTVITGASDDIYAARLAARQEEES